MAPRSPKSAPEAPTETTACLSWRRECMLDIKLPPNPDSTYKGPILPANLHQVYLYCCQKCHVLGRNNKSSSLKPSSETSQSGIHNFDRKEC